MGFCVSHFSIHPRKFEQRHDGVEAVWETLTRFFRVQGEASALMSLGKIQARVWRPGASRSTTHFVHLIPPNSPGVSVQGTHSLADVCVCVTPSLRFRNGFRHSEP